MVTKSGHAFVRDHSVPTFGEAWRDETGMVWSNALRRNQKVAHLDRATATEVCKSIGAELPTVRDYERQVVDGEILGGGVEAQFPPNLTGDVFWTSTPQPNYPSRGFVCNVYTPCYDLGENNPNVAVRCVARR